MDVFYDFRPDSDFYYLTGCSEPGFAALIDTTTGHFTLLSHRVPDDMLHWVGALPSLEELAEQYGADSCQYFEDAPGLLKAAGVSTIHALDNMVGPKALTAIDDMGLRPTSALLKGAVARSREIKTESEVACLQRASDITSEAHLEVMRAAPSSAFEYELEAVYLKTTRKHGLRHMGYPAIIGAGRNAAVLHYSRNDCAIAADEVVLMDAGSEYWCYTADITRTFPTNARFSAQMADVYDAVLTVQDHALSEIKPGTNWQDVTFTSRYLMANLLRDLNLVRGSPDDIVAAEVDKLFMPHGLGHFLGLDVHDVGGSGSPVPEKLLPGHVVTCEPGIYFVESLLEPALANPEKAGMLHGDRVRAMLPYGGVRIEDNLAITETEAVNLTSAPKLRSEVEAIASDGLAFRPT